MPSGTSLQQGGTCGYSWLIPLCSPWLIRDGARGSVTLRDPRSSWNVTGTAIPTLRLLTEAQLVVTHESFISRLSSLEESVPALGCLNRGERSPQSQPFS